LASLDDAVRLANVQGSLRALAAAVTFRALARLRAGQVSDAADDGRQALEYASGDRVDLDPWFAGAYLAAALLDAGDVDGADRVLASVRAFDDDATGPRYYAREVAARVRRQQNRPDQALALALDAGRIWAEFGFDNPAFGAWRSEAALAAYALGDRERASGLASDELDLAERWGAPRALAAARRTLGQVIGGDEGLHLLAGAVDAATDSLARVELATSLLAYGAALRRAGRRTDASELLTRALDLAEACGAESLVAATAVELRTAGFRPRRHRLSGPEALTVSERRVVDLAAEGASNRGIAQALFVTPKTVELHLTNAYRKLGVHGRGELALVLAAG
jgi:DNA-binding CsgD family transcriptional regulator